MLTNDKMTTVFPYLYASITKYYSQLNKLGPKHLPKCCSVQKINPCCWVLPFAGHMQRAGAAGHVALQLLQGLWHKVPSGFHGNLGFSPFRSQKGWIVCATCLKLLNSSGILNFGEQNDFGSFLAACFSHLQLLNSPQKAMV